MFSKPVKWKPFVSTCNLYYSKVSPRMNQNDCDLITCLILAPIMTSLEKQQHTSSSCYSQILLSTEESTRSRFYKAIFTSLPEASNLFDVTYLHILKNKHCCSCNIDWWDDILCDACTIHVQDLHTHFAASVIP